MLCGKCRKNQATKTYEQIKKGKKTVEYYCLDCYHRFMLTPETTEELFAECPYCGTTAEEVKKRNLVGCARCYQTLAHALMPTVAKLQGNEAHKGKSPVGGESERLSRRCHELKTIVNKLNAEKDFDGARAYTEILSELQSGLGEEEDYVWRKHPHLFKRS